MVYFSDEYSNDENIILNVDFFFNPTALRSFATSLVHIFVYIFGALLFSFMTFMGHFEINGLSKHTFYRAGDVSILLPRCGPGFLVETVEAGNRLGSRGKT